MNNNLYINLEDEKEFRNMRNNQKLTLRKKAVNQKIMEHRKNLEETRVLNFINVKNLNLSPFKDIIEQFLSLKTGDDKLLYMTTYLENNIEIIDIFSNLFFYENNSISLTDLDKYFLLLISSILDKNVMKRYFPGNIIKENNFIYNKDNPLKMNKKLFQIFFSILFNVKIKEVQVTIVNLLLSYSEYSCDFIKYCLEDIRYINKLFELTYIDNKEIIVEVGIILDNIIIFEYCDENLLKDILKHIPLIQRCQELISINNFNDSLKINYLELLYSIISKTDRENYKIFRNFINIFSNMLSTTPKNEDIFNLILGISSKISFDDSLCEEMIDKGLGYIFFNALSLPNMQREFIIKLLRIFSNLFYSDKIIKYFFDNFESKIFSVFIRIINTYMHTANDEDLKLIKELLFCLSNFATGPQETQTIISRSDIPKLVLQIMKIKNDNRIYFEGINFFSNIMYECNKETFMTISELHPFKIFTKGLEITGIAKDILLCLDSLQQLIQKNNEIYHTNENLKNEFYICCAKRKLDELSLHNNEKIAQKSKEILNYFDDKMKTD